TLLRESGYPALFRNHQPRYQDDEATKLFQAMRSGKLKSKAFKIDDELRRQLACNLGKARYSPKLEGHFALAESAYCHSTSPLRRLADFVNHRVLHAIAQQQPPPYSEEDLTELATHINRTLDQDQAEIDEVHRQKRHSLYRRQLDQERTVRSLEDDEFTRLLNFTLKDENQEDNFPAIRDEVLRRVDRLGVAEWAALLTAPGMVAQEPAIAQAIYDCLQQAPESAISTLDVLKSQKGWTVEFEVDGQPSHWVARAIIDNIADNTEGALTSPEGVSDRIKKQARAKGAIAWWDAYIQQTLIPLADAPDLDPTPPETPEPSPQELDRPEINPIAENFVGQLNTHCQRQGLPMAKERYSQSESGTFECELSLDGAIAQGHGRTKKLSKQWAAYELLKTLQVLD
ncbi:MAG: RNB domain-containing ribonuclease, partial [Cyanobacteria bacterium P01_H01_bin.130]